MNKIEEKIIKARLNGLSFSQLSEDQLRIATDQIMLRCSAISGCPTPMTEGFAEIISQELVWFITDFGYSNLTLEEIFTALRLNCSNEWRWPSGDQIERVDFTGSCFNVNYISKILNPYMVLRNNLDSKIKNKLSGY